MADRGDQPVLLGPDHCHCVAGGASAHTHSATSERPLTKEVWVNVTGFLTVSEDAILIAMGKTPDGHPQVWFLYRPESFEPYSIEDRQINLWIRQAEVFTSQQKAIDFLDRLIGDKVDWEPYDPIFPELLIGRRGNSRWLMCPGPLDPPAGIY